MKAAVGAAAGLLLTMTLIAASVGGVAESLLGMGGGSTTAPV